MTTHDKCRIQVYHKKCSFLLIYSHLIILHVFSVYVKSIQIKSNNLNVNLLHRLKCSILATLKQNQNVSNIFNVNEIQFQCVLLKSKVNQVTNYSNAILYYIQV